MRQPTAFTRHDRLVASALVWLIVGIVLLLTTAVPMHSDLLGWSGAFWMLLAPLALVLVLEPGLPRQLLALLRRPRARHAVWH